MFTFFWGKCRRNVQGENVRLELAFSKHLLQEYLENPKNDFKQTFHKKNIYYIVYIKLQIDPGG